MSRKIIYMAAPVRPSQQDINGISVSNDKLAIATATSRNIHRGCRWLRWLCQSFPEATFIAPWLASILSGEDDADPAQREAGLIDACAVIERCDGIALVGGRMSDGMRRELGHLIPSGTIYDFLRFGIVDPPEPRHFTQLAKWALESWAVKQPGWRV